MKQFFRVFNISLLSIIIIGGFYAVGSAAAQSRPLTVKGRVIDLTTGKGVSGVSLSGTNVPAGTATDADGRFAFTLDGGIIKQAPFGILAPTNIPGYNEAYASNNNFSNFWEPFYRRQVAGVRCRSENAACTESETVHDKGSSSRYDFAAEPAVSCTATPGAPQTIPSPADTVTYATSEPGVAFDGSTVMVAIRGSDGKSLWVNTSSNPERNTWKGWVIVGGNLTGAAPATRAIGKGRFAIFTNQSEGSFAVLRDAAKSRTPFIRSSDVSFTARDVIKFKSGKIFKFSKTSDGKIQSQPCS